MPKLPSPLWMAIEPRTSEVRLLLTEPSSGPSLKACLPLPAAHSRSLPMLLEALSAWYQMPLHAVLDADASDVREHPERWALLTGDLPAHRIGVEWVRRPRTSALRRRFLESMGDFQSARALVGFAATGQP
jgi:hypothetical protein